MTRWIDAHRKAGFTLLAAAAIAGLTATALLAQNNSPAPARAGQDEPIKRTILFKGDLDGVPGKEIVIFIADLAPGAVGGKHYHPGPEYFYVFEGTLAHVPDGAAPHMMPAGMLGSNPNKAIHVIKNGSMTERTKALDFLIADKGQPIVVPVN